MQKRVCLWRVNFNQFVLDVYIEREFCIIIVWLFFFLLCRLGRMAWVQRQHWSTTIIPPTTIKENLPFHINVIIIIIITTFKQALAPIHTPYLLHLVCFQLLHVYRSYLGFVSYIFSFATFNTFFHVSPMLSNVLRSHHQMPDP